MITISLEQFLVAQATQALTPHGHSVRMSVLPTDSHSLSHAFGTENISVLSTSSHHHSLSFTLVVF